MNLQECYEKCGGNYAETMQRLPSEQLVARFLRKFLDDTSYDSLTKSIAARDGEASFLAAHTLKGVTLNLGLSALFVPTDILTEALRNGWNEDAPALLVPVTEAYERTTDAIRMWQASQN